MSNRYVKIGIKCEDLQKTRIILEDILGIQFIEHESSYTGIYYLCKLSDSQNIQLVNNFQDGDWTEEKYNNCPLIVELNYLKEPEKVVSKILNNVEEAIFIKAHEIETGVSLKVFDWADGQFKLIREISLKIER